MIHFDNIETTIRKNIESILIMTLSNHYNKVSIDKIKKLIKKNFKYDADENIIEDVLNEIPIVKDITEDKTVLLDDTDEENEDEDLEDEDSIDEEIHDKAVDQAQDNLKMESVADALNTLKAGMKYDAKELVLNENSLYFPLHEGSIKVKAKYIVSDIIPKKDLNESLVRCKIDGSSLFIEMPIKSFIK